MRRVRPAPSMQVVSMLATIQSTVKAQATATAARPHASAAAAKYAQAMAAQAAQFGGAAAAAVKMNAVTPMQPKMRTRLFRKPTTLLSFFARAPAAAQPQRAAPGKAAAGVRAPGMLGKGVKRKSAGKAAAPGRDVKPAVKGEPARPVSRPTAKPEVVDLSEDTPVKAAKLGQAAKPAGAAVARRTAGSCPAGAGGAPQPDTDMAVLCKAEPAPEPPFPPAPMPDLPPTPPGHPSSSPDAGGPSEGKAYSAGVTPSADAATSGGSAARCGEPMPVSCEREGSGTASDRGGAEVAGGAMAVGRVAAAAGGDTSVPTGGADTPAAGGGCRVSGGAGGSGLSRWTKAGRLAARRAQSAEAEAGTSMELTAPDTKTVAGRVAAASAPAAEPVEAVSVPPATDPAKVAAETAAVQPLAEKQENGTGLTRAGAPPGGAEAKPHRDTTPAAASAGGKLATATAGRDAAPRAENSWPRASAAEQVMALGFGPAEVTVALKVCRGDASRAIEYLLSR